MYKISDTKVVKCLQIPPPDRLNSFKTPSFHIKEKIQAEIDGNEADKS